ncbi:MAG: RES family NAD+ phosphorylase [Gammaproteobacteria bacterium]|nr:RES family NAD+ phosphorylase [Gammaproteobacteria bacterium]
MNSSELSSLNRDRREAITHLFSGLLVIRSFSDFVRILHAQYEDDSLGLSSGPSRFGPITSTSGIVKAPAFRVLYMAADLATAAYETLIRDRYDLEPSRTLSPWDYRTRIAVNISTSFGETVTLVDLTDGNAIRHGVPSDVTSYSNHTDGQHFATFVHANISVVDGLLYRSRFTNKRNVAIFDRAIGRLAFGERLPLSRELLRPALRSWRVEVT